MSKKSQFNSEGNINLLISITLLILIASCGNQIPELGEWQSLGLEDKLVGKLHIFDNELYACAGRDGLYRIDLNIGDSDWDYLGLADTSISSMLESGVTDIIKANNDLVVSYGADFELQKSGIYRSNDSGETWIASDSGMSNQSYPTTSQVIKLDQHMSTPESIFACTATGLIYYSEDGGNAWKRIYGQDGAGAINYSIIINPNNLNEIWAGGETGRFAPFLIHTEDLGENWEIITFPQNFGPYTVDNAVYDIQMNPKNSNVYYYGMLGVIAKTTDKGRTFKRILNWDDGIYRHWCISINPENSSELISTGHFLYHSIDGGRTWLKIVPPDDRGELFALEVDWDNRIMYVSTSSPGNGIYRYVF
ncbi:MAG: hypothetical protein DRP93_03690 [Candidatus Neomarinimicrobiota bacterium]|nr:MAG: hypothetical protein DRP93_03690 [Candidatus Neomarinimicrobiota bacterium]